MDRCELHLLLHHSSAPVPGWRHFEHLSPRISHLHPGQSHLGAGFHLTSSTISAFPRQCTAEKIHRRRAPFRLGRSLATSTVRPIATSKSQVTSSPPSTTDAAYAIESAGGCEGLLDVCAGVEAWHWKGCSAQGWLRGEGDTCTRITRPQDFRSIAG